MCHRVKKYIHITDLTRCGMLRTVKCDPREVAQRLAPQPGPRLLHREVRAVLERVHEGLRAGQEREDARVFRDLLRRTGRAHPRSPVNL